MLAPELGDHARGRADERQSRLGHGLREARVLGQEAVAGMDRVRSRGARGVEQRVDDEVGLARGWRADAHRLVGEPDERRIGVRIGVHGDRREAHRATRAHHAECDLAAVRDQDLVEHGPDTIKLQRVPRRLTTRG